MTTNAFSLVGRFGLAAIFLWSALGKLGAPEATLGYIASSGLPAPKLALGVAILVELFGALAFVSGVAARAAAVALALFCLATAVIFHGPVGDQEQLIHFLKNVAMAGGLMQVAAFGAGAWTLAHLLAPARGRELSPA